MAVRPLYRIVLRTLRPLPPSPFARPEPAAAGNRRNSLVPNSALHRHMRSLFSKPTHSASPTARSSPSDVPGIAELEQFTTYIAAQKEYIRLLERYNPGINLVQEDRVRMTARRVGMEMPINSVDER